MGSGMPDQVGRGEVKINRQFSGESLRKLVSTERFLTMYTWVHHHGRESFGLTDTGFRSYIPTNKVEQGQL